MLCEMTQLQIEPIMTARAEPVSGIAAVRAEIELHRQFKMVFTFVVTQQQVQLAQGLAVLADRQVGGDYLDIWRSMQGELPQAFIIEAEAAYRFCGQPGVQVAGVFVLLNEPVSQPLRLPCPATGL